MDTISFSHYNQKSEYVSRTTLEEGSKKYFQYLDYVGADFPDETDALIFGSFTDYVDYITYDNDIKRNPRGPFFEFFMDLLQENKNTTLEELVSEYTLNLQNVFVHQSGENEIVVFFLVDY